MPGSRGPVYLQDGGQRQSRIFLMPSLRHEDSRASSECSRKAEMSLPAVVAIFAGWVGHRTIVWRKESTQKSPLP